MPRLVIADQGVRKCQSYRIVFSDTLNYCTIFLLQPIKESRNLHTHTYIHIHTLSHTHIHTLTHTHTYTHTHTHTHTHTAGGGRTHAHSQETYLLIAHYVLTQS
jgi:hypothetical protein